MLKQIKVFTLIALISVPLSAWCNDFSKIQQACEGIEQQLNQKIEQGQKPTEKDVAPHIAEFERQAKASSGAIAEAYRLAALTLKISVAQDQDVETAMSEGINGISPSSPAWEAFPDLAAQVVLSIPYFDPENAEAYIAGLIAHPVQAVNDGAKIGTILQQFYKGEMSAEDTLGKVKQLASSSSRLNVIENALSMIVKSGADMQGGESGLEVGKQAPGFTVSNFFNQSESYQLSSFKGKYLLVDFWATWCGPCIEELPKLADAYKKFQSKGFEILSVSSDDSDSDLSAFIEKGTVDMPWKHTRDGEKMASDYKVVYLPTLYLVDPNGKIIADGDLLQGGGLEDILSQVLTN